MQADFEDIVVLMEARPEHQIGLDFTLHGGRERGPIVVTSVEPGVLSVIPVLCLFRA